jgi:3-oxoacyl-ACP reductase-like protein
MSDWEKLEGYDENLPVTHHSECVPPLTPLSRLFSHAEPHRSVYPAIDPQQLYAAQAYQGKVVLVTGASRGIGQEISLQYARAGATLAITARAEDALEETKRAILAAVPSAQVLVHTADVRDVQSVERVVQVVLARFEKLDILIANAGAISEFGPST